METPDICSVPRFPTIRLSSIDTKFVMKFWIPFFVAAKFNGVDGQYSKLSDAIAGFKAIVNGEVDYLPEQAFYMVGTIEEAVEKAKGMA